MKELIADIYQAKSEYYLDFVRQLEEKNIPHILLNFSIPDDNPGDLDVMIDEKEHKIISQILTSLGFDFYYLYNTNQYLWNKYIENIGFIQIHIYVDFSFFGKKLLTFKQLFTGSQILSVELDYALFLIETFYKNEFKKKKEKNEVFQKEIKSDIFEILLQQTLKNQSKLILFSRDNFKQGNLTKKQLYSSILHHNKASGLVYLLTFNLKKIVKKLILKKNYTSIAFVGVDGAGKSTVVSQLKSILAKGGIFPQSKYFGIRTGFIFKFKNRLSRNDEQTNRSTTSKTESKKENAKKEFVKSSYNMVIGILYWIEYNLKWILKIKLGITNAKSVFLIDRTYFDILYFHDNKALYFLFFKCSFKPDYLIFLRGDLEVLYNRTKEYPISYLQKQDDFYQIIVKHANDNGIKTKVVDSVLDNPMILAHQILSFSIHHN